VWSTPSHILEESISKQDQIDNLHEVKKKREVTTINLMQAQVEEVIFCVP
jgi:hypothetical protein